MTQSKTPPHILVACFPKSGSTFMSRSIAQLPGVQFRSFCWEKQHNEQELQHDLLLNFNHEAWVAQHHVKNSPFLEKLLVKFNITPIVLVRDIFDVLVSLYDHLHTVPKSIPMLQRPSHFDDMSQQEKLHFLTHFAAPWYLTFYVSWFRYKGSQTVSFVAYEEMKADNQACLRRIMEEHPSLHHFIPHCAQALEDVSKVPTRKNKAVVGRGALFDEELRHQIILKSKFYPDVDFSLIGL